VDLFRARPGTYAPRFSTGRRADGRHDGRSDGPRNGRRRYPRANGAIYPPPGAVYIGASPFYYPSYDPSAIPLPGEPAAAAIAAQQEGFLRLVVSPRSAGVFVDGVYEGTVDDFGGIGETPLPAGLHRVRLEAGGFEPVEFDVRVPANDTITLRRELEPRRVPPLPPPPAAEPGTASAKPKPIYVIPRCYLGDSRPQQDDLPAGCNLADLRTLN
jgi:hypothetical protein